MRRAWAILSSSFKMALQELVKNKLRTFLSLFGVTIGIFCIIGVLATVSSLEQNIQSEIKSLGTNTIYIDKWEWSTGLDYPWWKYINRPVPRYKEVAQLQSRTSTAENIAFIIQGSGDVEAGDNIMKSILVYGISETFGSIQPLNVAQGRNLTETEYDAGTNSMLMGAEVAEKLFGTSERALNKMVTVRGKKVSIVGVIKKQGAEMFGGWQFDKSVVMPYRFTRTLIDELTSDPKILVQGRENINSKVLQDDLRGAMRGIRRLSPTQDDNFALNDINVLSDNFSKAFVSVNIGGWAIGALSFIVGIFGVANIMFVTVKERTAQIGLKKAIGAKSRLILLEFLAESAFLCIIGGIIGLLLVFLLTKIVTAFFDFPIFLSPGTIGLAIGICILAGIVAGIIPASQAARMDPVVAIRSK